MDAGGAEGEQSTEIGSALLDHPEARLTNPRMAVQALFQLRQGDALFFQFDDTVEAAAQHKAAVFLQLSGIGGLLQLTRR